MLVTTIFKQLKIGFAALTVKFHKFWAVLHSNPGEMNIEKELSYFLLWYYISIISVCSCIVKLDYHHYFPCSNYI